jgi:Lar family restriction alleviation protein
MTLEQLLELLAISDDREISSTGIFLKNKSRTIAFSIRIKSLYECLEKEEFSIEQPADIKAWFLGEPELLPCPFCGGKAVNVSQYSPEVPAYWEVKCHSCTARINHQPAKAEAIEAWNRRVSK